MMKCAWVIRYCMDKAVIVLWVISKLDVYFPD